MGRIRHAIGALAVLVSLPAPAAAELHENQGAVEFVGLLPNFQPDAQRPAAFSIGGWGVAASFEHGILFDLMLGVRGTYSQFTGQTDDATVVSLATGRPQTGNLVYDGHFINGMVFARYTLLAGYPITPYVEAGMGFLVSVHLNHELIDGQNRLITNSIAELTTVNMTLHAGLMVDYRFLDMFAIRTGVRFAKVIDDQRISSWLEFPLTLAVYWSWP